jgi:hypothetical protein
VPLLRYTTPTVTGKTLMTEDTEWPMRWVKSNQTTGNWDKIGYFRFRKQPVRSSQWKLSVKFFTETEDRTSKVSTVQPTRCTYNFKLFILVKHSTCFGRSFRLSSEDQNSVYSNGICQTAAATCCCRGWDGNPLTYTVVVYTVLIFWWWTERPSKICRAFYKNK